MIQAFVRYVFFWKRNGMIFLRKQSGQISNAMAKYSKKAQKQVKKAMHKKKEGTLRSGSGKKVTSSRQAIAIGLSEAREKGAKVPKKKGAKKTSRKKSGSKS